MIEPKELRDTSEVSHKLIPNDANISRRRTRIRTARLSLFDQITRQQYQEIRKLNLKTLTLDISALYCPSGCCREGAVEMICESFWWRFRTARNAAQSAQGKEKGLFHTKLRIIGLGGKHEYWILQGFAGLSLDVEVADNVCEIML